jgi:DNA helicase-2/ATP-dependent DNA helicase PcrA
MSREYVLRPFRPQVQLQIDYARELNEQQYAAATALPGPSLVIAGAGSGKTRTLTYRVAYLLEQGIPPDRILLLTFTNKAAHEMMRRVSELLGQDLPELWGGTFHSIGNRILRQHAPLLGYQRDFTILDREDAEQLIGTCVAEAGIDKTAAHFPKKQVLASLFSMAANTRQTIGSLLESKYEDFLGWAEQIGAVAKAYRERKRETGGMDFDDLLVLWLQLLNDHPEVREEYGRRFQFLLVDEYQDTNRLQSEIIDLLAEREQNLMVVGDDAQSIYAWRGANYANIMQFPVRYPTAKVYKIETNYRSTPQILQVANAAIKANEKQFAKELNAVRKPGEKPALVACGDSSQQAGFVAQRVLELAEEGCSLNEMVVLYRSHFHALELQLELTRRNIPFVISSGMRFFEQAHIKDVAAYLKLAANPRDELSFKRLVLLLPGIGDKGADKLWKVYKEAVTRFIAAIEPVAGPLVARALQAAGAAVGKKTVVAWAQFVATVAQLETPPAVGAPGKMIRVVLEAGYEDYLEETYPNYQIRLEDLTQLASYSLQFENLQEFLAQLALVSNVEAEAEPQDKDEDRLRLSTIHQAKGLEFKVVFVIMLCDGLFPSARSVEGGDPDAMEEERRLFYVAVTRAKDELYLTYPLMRAGYDGMGLSMQHPSQFIGEIPTELLNEWNLRPW